MNVEGWQLLVAAAGLLVAVLMSAKATRDKLRDDLRADTKNLSNRMETQHGALREAVAAVDNRVARIEGAADRDLRNEVRGITERLDRIEPSTTRKAIRVLRLRRTCS